LINLTKDCNYNTSGFDFSNYTVLEERLPVAYFGISLISTIPIFFISKAYDINLYALPEVINDFLGSPLNGFFMFFYPTIFYTIFGIYAFAMSAIRTTRSMEKLEDSLSKSETLTGKIKENLTQLKDKFDRLN
jgi:hypothetical protein